MNYCQKHHVYGYCPSCEREVKPISYGKDRNGGVRSIYVHGVEVVGAVLSSEAMDLVDRVNALLRVYDAEIQHGLASIRLLGDERDALRAENERLRRWVVRARCGCTSLDCRLHGAYDPADADGALALAYDVEWKGVR